MKELKEVLLNQKAYEIYTGQGQKEVFNVKTGVALKRCHLTEKELKQINPTQNSDQKVFYFTKEGIGRIYYNGKEVVDTFGKYTSQEKILEGAIAAGYKA